jgi:hypothetical protein
MKKIILIFLVFSFSINIVQAQNATNILCTDITMNDGTFYDGKIFTKGFESILSNLEMPPRIVDRKNLSSVLEKIQEDKNLFKDLKVEYIDSLKIAKIDYLVYANFSKSKASETYTFQSECVKISGDNALSKIVFPSLNFTEKDLVNTTVFENRIREMLKKYSFTKELGIIDYNLSLKNKNQFDEKDKEIRDLKQQVTSIRQEKDRVTILKNTAPQVDFSLEFKDSSLFVVTRFWNDVPIKMTPYIFNIWDESQHSYSDLLNNVYISPKDIFPKDDKNIVNYFNYGKLRDKLPVDRRIFLRVVIRYSSLYSDEIDKPELQEKEVKLDYVILPNSLKMQRTTFKE